MSKFSARLGDPKSQSLWEFVTLLLALMLWARLGDEYPIVFHGDNIAALQDALSLKGRGSMLAVAREIAWRKERFQWNFTVAHLPSELNKIADDLSRLSAVPCHTFPLSLSRGCTKVNPPGWQHVWLAWVM